MEPINFINNAIKGQSGPRWNNMHHVGTLTFFQWNLLVAKLNPNNVRFELRNPNLI